MADPIVAFDVNETLLDTGALDPLFERHFGDAAVRPVWFSQMLQLAFVGGLTGRYVDFSSAQRAATLSNSPPGPAERQIENAGLRPSLDAVLSAGEIATQILKRR